MVIDGNRNDRSSRGRTLQARAKEIETAVRDALEEVDGVTVDLVSDGRVVLHGDVTHQAMGEAARIIASSVEWVVSVDTTRIRYRRALFDR